MQASTNFNLLYVGILSKICPGDSQIIYFGELIISPSIYLNCELFFNKRKDEKYFVQDVLGPIKYHVKAKRYLAREEKYYRLLSEASKISLKLQGGIMNNEEAQKFESNKFFKSSIKLRKFDEVAKKSGLKIKSINEYKNLLTSKLI